MHDSEVVESIAGDRSGGLTEAYDRYADSLYKYCLASLGEPAEAADAVQDTFVIAAARLADLREPDRLRAWLYAVARNECQRIARPRQPEFASAAPAQFVMAGAPKVQEDEAERARLRGLLDDATTGLTPGEREVIELELRQGLAVAEVASVVGVSRTRANALASRAREHLGDSLEAVVVARTGRRDCRLLSGMLAGWDGELTVTLREQLHRHIGRCATCSTRRDLELHPARLLGQSPGEALAAAAADSLRAAAGAPDALRAHTLALAAGQEPEAIAHRGAVLSQAGIFDSQGFPKPAPEPKEVPARGDGGRPARRRRRVALAAGLVAAAVVGTVAVALIDSSGHGKQAAGHLADSVPPTEASAAAPFGASPGTSPTNSATRTAAKATAKTTGSATTAPQGTPTAANRATTPAAPASGTTDPTGTAPASTATPTVTPTPGTLSVSPSGGALWVPPGGTTISLIAHGGPVTWSSTVSSGSGTVQLSPSGGTIKAGATATVTVTASGSAAGRQVTINPGGTSFTIFIALLAWSRSSHLLLLFRGHGARRRTPSAVPSVA
jgi:RNA polymerase sigma factor (sigma-70 family)